MAEGGDLGVLFSDGVVGDRSDEDLVTILARGGPGASTAFGVIVSRHAAAVWKVCRAIARDDAGAEDAFQATFLVLSRKAGAIRRPEELGGWLAGVARRVARKSRDRDARRPDREHRAARREAAHEADPAAEAEAREARSAVRREVKLLPEKYREPVALCYLDGLTHDEAADRLRWPVGTVRGRLARARDLLRSRLTRRGLAPEALAVTAMPPRCLVENSVRLVSSPPADAVSTLADATLRSILVFQIRLAAASIALALTAAAGLAWLAFPSIGSSKPAEPPTIQPRPRPSTALVLQDPSKPKYQMSGRVTVEGTDEPVPGARLSILLSDSGPEHKAESRDAVTDEEGWFRAELPSGEARAWTLWPPPGYWAPGNLKQLQDFVLTPEVPTFRKDYRVRPGTAWTIAVERDGRPLEGGGFVSSYRAEDQTNFLAEIGLDGRALISLPTEAGDLTLNVGPMQASSVSYAPVSIRWDAGFRPDVVESPPPPEGNGPFLLRDREGRTATLGANDGKVSPAIRDGHLTIRVRMEGEIPGANGSIAGTVVDSRGLPVAGAKIALVLGDKQRSGMTNDPRHRVETDEQGAFRMDGLPRRLPNGDSSRYSLIVTKDGLAGVDTPLAPVPETPGDMPARVSPIRMDPESIIQGRVVDAKGRPAAGAWVEPGGGYSARSRFVRTNDDGRFVVRGLARGVVPISARHGDAMAQGRYVTGGEEFAMVLGPSPNLERLQAEAAARKAKIAQVDVGQEAPEWTLGPWSDGRERSIASVRGSVVLLDFWGLWCGPCVRSLPAMEALRREYEPKGVVFLSIHTASGDPDQIRRLLEQNEATTPFAIDRGEFRDGNGDTADRYGVRGYPSIVVIDKKGRILSHPSDPALRDKVKAAMESLGLDEATLNANDMNNLFHALYSRELDAALDRP